MNFALLAGALEGLEFGAMVDVINRIS